MHKRLRIFVLGIVAVLSGAALRKTFSSSGEIVLSDHEEIAAVNAEYAESSSSGNEQKTLPGKKERADYLVGSTDPTVLYKKYLLATYLYEKHQAEQALPLAISYATQLGRYDEASALLKKLPDISSLQDTLEIPVLMKLLFNTSDLSFAQLKHLKEFVETLRQQWSIDQASYNFYYFVITLIKGDMENAQFYLAWFEQGVYAKQYSQLRTLEKATKAYGNTPLYYLRGVRAMYLYQQWRWWPARYIGQQLRQEDPNYLLAEQLIAYSSMALQDRKAAIFSLQQLQKIDPSYSDVYQFFQGIAHYSLQEYETTILLFEQLPKESAYYADVVRYLFLSYAALGDHDNVGKKLDAMLANKKLLDADVYTIFDTILYGKEMHAWYTLYQRFSDRLETVEQRCQQELSDRAYICLYGKWGILLAQWEKQKAYALMGRIVSWYPRWSLYTLLGDLAWELGYDDQAESRYQKWFLLQQQEVSPSLEHTQQFGLQ